MVDQKKDKDPLAGLDSLTSSKSYQQWREMSQAHWNHWRAWGSWFSWGSPVGLGLFFVLLAIAFAIVVWIVKL